MVVVLVMRGGARVAYPRRHVKTRRQVAVLCAVSTLVLLPPLAWRFTVEPIEVSIALAGLALVAPVLCVRGLRFLAGQEQQHPEPTPGMTFLFALLAVYPPAINVFLLILLAEM